LESCGTALFSKQAMHHGIMRVTTHISPFSELTGLDDAEKKDFINQRIHPDMNLFILQRI
jgi:hypothetical protein